MKFVEELNDLRYYKPFIEAGGGVKQVQTACGGASGTP
jgi:hypothetical protein